MEDTLRVYSSQHRTIFLSVLILVLMEDTLRGTDDLFEENYI